MKQTLAIAAGGALGSALRYWVSTWVYGWLGRGFPYGTLAVNVIGCFAMGFLFVLFLERLGSDGLLRAGILIGVLGGFTTFSAFSIETFGLMEQGDYTRAMSNVAASVILCLAATWIGALAGRSL